MDQCYGSKKTRPSMRQQQKVPYKGKAQQKDSFPEVVMKMPKNDKIVAKVPNGEVMTVLEVDGDGPNGQCRVRWKDSEGWVKMCNVVPAEFQPAAGPSPQEVGYAQRLQPEVPYKGKAQQQDHFPEVVMKMPKNDKIVAKVPNGEAMTVLEVDRDGPHRQCRVRWKETEGWVKMCNVIPGEPADETFLESAKELVQKAQSVMQEYADRPPEVGIPKYTQPESILEILDRHWICEVCAKALPPKRCSFPAPEAICVTCCRPRPGQLSLLSDSDARPVKLLRGSWLLSYAASEGTQKGISRRQLLEATVGMDAFLHTKEVECKKPKIKGELFEAESRSLNIVSISYCWLAMEHPDSDGRQLQVVANTLRSEGAKYSKTFGAVGIFWDFGSLHQKDLNKRPTRTPIEMIQFSEALRVMGIWYVHEMIVTYLLTDSFAPGIVYESRGWTHFERSCAEMFKPAGAGREGPSYTYPMIVDTKQDSDRRLPITPESFAEHLAQRQFTSRGDRETVVRLYTETFMYAVRGLRDFALEEFTLCPGDGAVLASVLLHFASLESLNLRGTGITGTELQFVAAALPDCNSLQKLDLCGNVIGEEGAKAIAAAIPKCDSLTRLWLSGGKMGGEGAKSIAAALPSCTLLKALYVSSNQIAGDGAQAILAAIPNCGSLDTLDLSRNNIGDEGAEAIAAALPNCNSLRKIDLSGSEIGDEGATAIAAAIPNLGLLDTLNLSGNNIGDEGAEAIAAALPRCGSLKSLDIYTNQIGDEGAKAIAATLPSCTSLEELDLDTTSIGDDGAKALREAHRQIKSSGRYLNLHQYGS